MAALAGKSGGVLNIVARNSLDCVSSPQENTAWSIVTSFWAPKKIFCECIYLGRILDNDIILISLRDFFAARDGHAMAAACATLTKAAPPADGHPASADTADELEYAFNRLFVGPGAVPAPPYASVYLDPDHGLMGESTRIAAAVYDALGVSSPSNGSLPDDHLALELDAAVVFHALKAREQSAELAALWDYFLRDHLMLWVPLFVACIKQVPDVPPAISHVASLLSAWLSEECGAKPVTHVPPCIN
jgi:TorA maturation chaperone TorD